MFPVRTKYVMIIIRDDYLGFTKVNFLRSKDDTAEYFTKNLVDIVPRRVKLMRSDGGGRG